MGIMKFCQVQGLCYLTMLRETHRKTMGIVKFCQVLGHALHEKYRASRLGLYLRQWVLGPGEVHFQGEKRSTDSDEG